MPPFVPFADSASGWLIETDAVRSSTVILLTLVAVGVLAGVLYQVGVIGFVLRVVGAVIRGGTRAGFRTWEQALAWAPWPLFLAVQLTLLAVGVGVNEAAAVVSVGCALAALGLGLAAVLAYMFIDVERYEVARGYKALHDPLKGQKLAGELAKYGHRLGLPLLGSAGVGMIGGFALLNLGLFRLLGTRWYTPPGDDATYFDFVASALVHLLSVVDLLNLVDTHHLMRVVLARPAPGLPAALLAGFKSFFTLVLLQQIFASVRKGRLLTETIADFWSPHQPIHERARVALPQYGAVALDPLLLSLRTSDALTREQRDQLPRVLATIGPAAVPALAHHLGDANEHVRAVAAATLGRLRATATFPRLAALARDPSDLVRVSVAEALGEAGGGVTPAADRPHRRRRTFPFRVRLPWRPAPVVPVDPVAVAVPALQAAVMDSAAAVRGQAAASLGRLRAAEAVPDLITLFADADETVRTRAAEAVGLAGADDPRTVPALAGLLADPSPAIRAAAAAALGGLRGRAVEAVPDLVGLLHDRDDEVRQAAADAVGRIGVLPEPAADALAAGLASDDTVVRARTAEAVGAIGGAAADIAPALVEAVQDENDRVRAKAVEALGKIGESAAEIAVPRLVRALKDPDDWVTARAAAALGVRGDGADEAVPALVRSLAHANPQVRANAVQALGKLGPAAGPAAAAVEQAAADADGGVRLAAVRALGAIGQPTSRGVQVVRGALADLDPQTRAAAAEAFGTWGVADDGVQTDLIGLLADPNDEVKVRVIRVLPKLVGSTPAAVDGLVNRLAADDSDAVRAEAARALGQLGPAVVGAGAELLRAAQTGAADVREEAMRALVLAQPPEAAAAFASGLRDAEPAVRKLASAGWRKAAEIPEEAVPALIEALLDPDVQVRANAAHAVGRIDPVPAEAVPPLAACAVHPDVGLRLNAALALQAVPGRAASDALHLLLDDPNPRLRLIAARRILRDDPTDTQAVAVVTDALNSSHPGIAAAAAEVMAAVAPPPEDDKPDSPEAETEPVAVPVVAY